MATLIPRKTINYKQRSYTLTKGEANIVESDSTFIGSVQPVTGKDLESLEVGREDRGKVKVYSDTRLNVSIAGTDKPGDLIIWEGQKWEAIEEKIYQNGLIPHYRYIAEFRKNV